MTPEEYLNSFCPQERPYVAMNTDCYDITFDIIEIDNIKNLKENIDKSIPISNQSVYNYILILRCKEIDVENQLVLSFRVVDYDLKTNEFKIEPCDFIKKLLNGASLFDLQYWDVTGTPETFAKFKLMVAEKMVDLKQRLFTRNEALFIWESQLAD